MKPIILSGDIHTDKRGRIFHVNNFDLSKIKRIYIIENKSTVLQRGWKGHLVEKRWFICSYGEVEIKVISIDSFKTHNPNHQTYVLSDTDLNVLYVPEGYATMIRQAKKKSRVMAMSDYLLGTSNDENLRWNSNFF